MTKRKEQQPKYKQSETVVIKRSQINFAPYNPRKEDPEVIKKLKKNFKTVGYLGGIVWNQLSSYLVSGHKRVQTLDIINNYDGADFYLIAQLCSRVVQRFCCRKG